MMNTTKDANDWCIYIAGMLDCYLKTNPPAEEREAAMAGIIQRRLHSYAGFAADLSALRAALARPQQVAEKWPPSDRDILQDWSDTELDKFGNRDVCAFARKILHDYAASRAPVAVGVEPALKNRAIELHEKAGMPWTQALELAMSEQGVSLPLYQAINKLVCQIGCDGSIDSRHALVTEVMDALHDLDGGINIAAGAGGSVGAESDPASGIKPGETVAEATEGWAQWCEFRGNTMLAKFLRGLTTPAHSVPLGDKGDATRLLYRAMKQLDRWSEKYGAWQPEWLPPAGDVELAEDIEEFIAKRSVPAIQAQDAAPVEPVGVRCLRAAVGLPFAPLDEVAAEAVKRLNADSDRPEASPERTE
jgi:hypothetical protein